MVQAQERVKTHVLGGIRRGLLKEVSLKGFTLLWRRYNISGREEIKKKVIVSRSKGRVLMEEMMFYFPQRVGYVMQNLRR